MRFAKEFDFDAFFPSVDLATQYRQAAWKWTYDSTRWTTVPPLPSDLYTAETWNAATGQAGKEMADRIDAQIVADIVRGYPLTVREGAQSRV